METTKQIEKQQLSSICSTCQQANYAILTNIMNTRQKHHDRPNGEASGTAYKTCDWSGCNSAGEHRAPKSKEDIRNYFWFCKKHAREYNLSWNYYAGMTDEDVDNKIRSDTTWNRPTWPLGGPPGENLYGKFFTSFNGKDEDKNNRAHVNFEEPSGFFHDNNLRSESTGISPKDTLSALERKSLSILGFDKLVKMEELKNRYKTLAKRFHPDATGGNKEAEERLKRINKAYDIILNKMETKH